MQQLLLLGLRIAPATLPEAATAASGATQRCCKSAATLQDAANAASEATQRFCNAAARLQDAANATSEATQRFCNASGRCNGCFWGHATLLQRFCNALGHCSFCFWAHALPATVVPVQLLLLGHRNAPATPQNAIPGTTGAQGISGSQFSRSSGRFLLDFRPNPKKII